MGVSVKKKLDEKQGGSAGNAPEARAAKVLAGNVRAASRLMTEVQNGDRASRSVLRLLYPHCGSADLIGITGPPGAGKSTLVSALIGELRSRDLTVGVVAVDPSSPFSGGAVLGDRDRMEGFTRDDGVFIRSMASRGATGGLCAAANDAVDILDAMGKDVVLIETVGVGQSEVEIAQIANSVVLTLVPGYGDSLQAMKAGIMEVADIMVVNKADSPGADAAVKDLKGMGYYQPVPEGEQMWEVPIVSTVARRGEGVDHLVSEVLRQLDFAETTGWKSARQRARRSRQFLDVLTDKIRKDFAHAMNSEDQSSGLLEKVESMAIDPYFASDEIVERFRNLIGSD